MTKLFLLGMEHECAQRVPDKPLRPFGDTCLFDIYLDKLITMSLELPGEPGRELAYPFSGFGVALWPGDRRLLAKAILHGVPVIERDEASRNAHNDLATQFNFLQDIDCDWFLWPNGCAPFLRIETILDIAQMFHNGSPRPFTTVQNKNDWIWGTNELPMNTHAGSTQDTEPYYKSTYNVHLFSKHDLARYGHYWPDSNEDTGPILYLMQDEVESMDIDTMEDFKACEKEWKKRHE